MPAGQICDANKQEKAERDQYIALTGCHRSQAPLKFPFRKFQPATEQALPDRLLMWVQPGGSTRQFSGRFEAWVA
jgi:hypothetical protein